MSLNNDYTGYISSSVLNSNSRPPPTPYIRKISEEDNGNSGCIGLLCFALCMTPFLALPIIELYTGLKYNNYVICDSNMGISIPTWLIVKSTIGLCLVLSIQFHKYLVVKKAPFYCVVSLIYWLCGLFNIIWVILGSIIVFRDCPELKPEFVNTFIKVDIILGFISMIQYLCISKQ